jgi:predicted Zn-dependent protease
MSRAQIVVTDTRLLGPTQEAAAHWSNATNNSVNWTFVDRCSSGIACITVSVKDLKAYERIGNCKSMRDLFSGNATAEVSIDPDVLTRYSNGPLPIIVHELGHALGLDHTNDSVDVMRPIMDGTKFCITETNVSAYAKVHGGNVKNMQPHCLAPTRSGVKNDG